MSAENHPGTIIYADDEFEVRRIYDRILNLKFPDYVKEGFENGDALEKRLNEFERAVPNVVILDNTMPPGKSGLEIIKKYSAQERFRGTPFILASAEDKKEEALRYGAYAFIEKPLDFPHFVSVVEGALRYSVGGFGK